MATGNAVEQAAGGRAFPSGAMRRLGPALAAATLAAMPGAARAVPPAPPVVVLSAAPKLLKLSWPRVATATAYKVMKDPTGTSGFTQVGADIPQIAAGAVVWSSAVAVHKLAWSSVLYQVQACNASGCTASASVSPATAMLGAVGYVKASNPDGGDTFGCAVAMSADGNTFAVGACGEASNAAGVNGNQADNSLARAGAVYVFARSGLTWAQQAYLKAPNVTLESQFGAALSLSDDGSRLAVGAPYHDGLSGPGMAYVFGRSGTSWAFEQTLAASNPDDGDAFGHAVVLSGDGYTLAVGAPLESSASSGIGGDQASNAIADSGAVYVFKKSYGIWAQQAYVKAQSPALAGLFGWSVALSADGNTLAAGSPVAFAPGTTSVYTRAGTTWSWQATLAGAGLAGDSFGVAASLSGDGNTLAVGAPGESAGAGAAYLLTRSGTSWAQQARLVPVVAEANDSFGGALALSSDGLWLAVGATGEDGGSGGVGGNPADNGAAGAGAAYVFQGTAGAWAQTAYVKASNPEAVDGFGHSLGLGTGGAPLIVGARSEDGDATGVVTGSAATTNAKSDAGAAYLY